jgi:hypothetical protein
MDLLGSAPDGGRSGSFMIDGDHVSVRLADSGFKGTTRNPPHLLDARSML